MLDKYGIKLKDTMANAARNCVDGVRDCNVNGDKISVHHNGINYKIEITASTQFPHSPADRYTSSLCNGLIRPIDETQWKCTMCGMKITYKEIIEEMNKERQSLC